MTRAVCLAAALALCVSALTLPRLSHAEEHRRPAPPTDAEMRPVENPPRSVLDRRGDGRPPGPLQSMSERDRARYLAGPVSNFDWALGGLVGTFLGFGVGHAVQGRYGTDGWIFTVGEGGALAAMVISLPRCLATTDDRPCFFTLGAYLTYVGVRVWELIDVWGGPQWHNERLRELGHPRITARRPPERSRWQLALVPTRRGGALGVVASF